MKLLTYVIQKMLLTLKVHQFGTMLLLFLALVTLILSVTPLAVAWGAGSASQNAIGTGVIGGMITATVLAIFLVPVFYVVVRKIFKSRNKPILAATTIQNQPSSSATENPSAT